MSISVVQASTLSLADADSTDFTANAASNFTAGNTVLVPVSHWASATSISGVTINGTAATRDTPATSNSGARAEIWRVFNVSGGGSGVTITYSGGTDNFLAFDIVEVTPLELDTGTPNGATSTGNTCAVSTAATTSVPDTFVLSVIADGTGVNPAWGGGLTNVLWTENDGTTHVVGRASYSIETTTGTKTSTYTATNTPAWAQVIAAYKEAAGAPASAPKRALLLGVG